MTNKNVFVLAFGKKLLTNLNQINRQCLKSRKIAQTKNVLLFVAFKWCISFQNKSDLYANINPTKIQIPRLLENKRTRKQNFGVCDNAATKSTDRSWFYSTHTNRGTSGLNQQNLPSLIICGNKNKLRYIFRSFNRQYCLA